ncbi:unnamed protein product [Mytilus edulis]|uniref:SCP domain-containing protein n=1 Tax=Mytilus edulis TaxID=6550 RepID=A0A8S3UZN6_MYTED|nr:unnamed protein product [Mytilus edulis]
MIGIVKSTCIDTEEKLTIQGQGHFSQVVWKESREVGVGRARTNDGKVVVVTNYSPAGNRPGAYSTNVLPPRTHQNMNKQRTNFCGWKLFEMTSKPKKSRSKKTSLDDDSDQISGAIKQKIEEDTSFIGGISSIMASIGEFLLLIQFDHNLLAFSITFGHCTQVGKRLNMFGRSGGGGESRSTKTFTETTGSGANKVTKTVVEETIIKADGSKTTNRKETITHGGSSNSSTPALQSSSFPSHDDSKKKEKDKGGVLGERIKDGSSSSDSSPETSKKPQNLKAFIDDAVKTHNDLRKKHGVPSVKHAKDLSDYAQKWAEHMAATSSFGHSSCTLKSDRLGENIACRSGTGTVDYTGHFTQVVWKETKEVGFGKAKSSGGRVFVVGSYRPAGNMVGNYKDNVPAPKK